MNNLNGTHGYEAELLLPRNTRFRILATIQQQDNPPLLRLEIIP